LGLFTQGKKGGGKKPPLGKSSQIVGTPENFLGENVKKADKIGKR